MTVPPSNMGWPTGYIPTAQEWAASQSVKVDFPAPIDQGGTGGQSAFSSNYNLQQRALISATDQTVAALGLYGAVTESIALTINLPPLSSLGDGDWIQIVDVSGNAGTHNITVAAASGDMIDLDGTSAATQAMSYDGAYAIFIVSDGVWIMALFSTTAATESAIAAAAAAEASEGAAADSAADAATSAGEAAASAAIITALENYFPTIAAGVSGTAVGDLFTSDESGTLTLYAHIAGSPFYEVVPWPWGGSVLSIEGLSSLKAFAATANQAVILVDGKRSGTFVFFDADYSEQVAVDPLSGVFVPPDSDDTGASGAWVRIDAIALGWVTPEWCGAAADFLELGGGATDDSAAIWAAYNLLGPTTGLYQLDMPGIYLAATFNPDVDERCCLPFNTQGTIITGRYQNQRALIGGPFTVYYLAESLGQEADSYIEVSGGGVTMRNFGWGVDVSGTPAEVFGKAVQYSHENYVNRCAMQDCGGLVSNGTCDENIGGEVWGSSFRDIVVQGATSKNFAIGASTSNVVENVYTNGGEMGLHFDTAWYLNVTGCSADNASQYGYHFGSNCRSATLTQCGSEQCRQALWVEGGKIVIDGFYYQVSDAGAVSDYPLVVSGGSVTASGISPVNRHPPSPTLGIGKVLLVSGGYFECTDGSITPSEVEVTGDGQAWVNGTQVLSTSAQEMGGALLTDPVSGNRVPFSFLTGRSIGNMFGIGLVRPGGDWVGSAVTPLDAVVRPSAYNRFIYTCTTAGTTGSSEPSWGTTAGGTTSDGSVVWTASLYSSDELGPIQGFHGSGGITFGDQTAGYSGLSTQSEHGLQITNNGMPVSFYGGTSEFDLNDDSLSPMLVGNTQLIVFDRWTFNVLSPMGPFFDAYSSSNTANNGTTIIIKANCRFRGLDYVKPQEGQYLRTSAMQPSYSYGNKASEFSVMMGGDFSGIASSIPKDSYWDKGLVCSRETNMAAGGYEGDACVRAGYAPKYTWAATMPVALGDTVVPTVDNTHVYSCTVAGTTAGTQPTWPTTAGNTVVDGTVTWKCAVVPAAYFRGSGLIQS